MRQRQSSRTVNASPSISVIQGAYDSFCAPSEQETVYECTVGGSFVSYSPHDVVTDPDVRDWFVFQGLVREWQQQRGAMSSITEAATCPAYQSIIGMGVTAVPFLLLQLESEGDEPDQWFWALAAITGEDPVRDEDRGDYVQMAQAWLDWGRRQNAW